MKPFLLLVLCGALLAGGCGSASHASAAPSAGTSAGARPECVCGTHEAQIHGCHAPECMSGQGNPNNPKCTCAPLKPAAPKGG